MAEAGGKGKGRGVSRRIIQYASEAIFFTVCRRLACCRSREAAYDFDMQSCVRQANKSGQPPLWRLGLIVNPIAGMGGPSGQKGTDSASALKRASESGVKPLASARAARALGKLCPMADKFTVIAAAGCMGADLVLDLGFAVTSVGTRRAETGPEDTRAAACMIADHGVDMLMFAGGDGTARDVFDAVPQAPLLGIPTGVKMHSAVFAASPEAAGYVAAGIMRDPQAARWRQAEIMDIDEDLLCVGHLATRLHGYACVPEERQLMQNCKARSSRDDGPALQALANRLVAEMEPSRLYVLGCGETMRYIKRLLGGEGTLLGVDVALGGRLIATDLDEARLLRLTGDAPTSVIVSVTGGQGFIFGRGNQQISARLLARIGRENVTIITGQRKLTDLDPSCLRVDTGDLSVDAMLAGYMRVQTAPGRSMMMRVAA
jgi:predicted polyphosphate/ATP-dependent NAD kinase